jgi:Fe-S cluster assembly iron-binding protein IscA
MEGEQDMLVVSEVASASLAQMLQQREFPEGTAIRLVQAPKGMALQSDTQREGDTVFEHEGRTVLLLDAQVSELLSNSTLDMEGDTLALRHANSNE